MPVDTAPSLQPKRLADALFVYTLCTALEREEMGNRLKLAFELLFRGQSEGESSPAVDRMAREIAGSIFALLALFELVSLTSYLPIDSYNLYQGHIDQVRNLGGLVGALLAHWFLGNIGIAGYALVILTAWLSLCAFRGIPLGVNLLRMLGCVIASCLAAITCHLIVPARVDIASLWQGGRIGTLAGNFLRAYLNTTGALLMVGGAFLITCILTMGLSITRGLESVLETDENDAEEQAPAAAASPRPALVPAPPPVPTPPAAPKKRARKKKADSEPQPGDEGNPIGPQAGDDAGDPDVAATAAPSGPPVFEELIPHPGPYSLPTTRLLKGDTGNAKRLSRGEIKEHSTRLCEHLLSFQITGEVVKVSQGPVLTTYEYKPAAGVKLSKIAGLQDDLGVVFGTSELRVVAPIPGKTVVGIEVPRPSPEMIPFKDVVSEDAFQDKKLKLPIALGKNTDGVAVCGDLAAMPHLLVAGSTGSGKSVFMNCLIMSLIYRLSPQQLRMILVDPKMLEFRAFEGIPHLLTPVITNNNIAFNALNWAVEEMDRRYRMMADTGSKNIESYNSKMKQATKKLPYIVVVVDELADLMMSGGEMVEVAITRLAQKARAAGIHLVIATQRPSTDVITGLIKANIPSRLAFKVPSAVDSRTVLDSSGAEALIGKGDSLMITPGIPLRRLHGCYLTEEELERVMKYIKAGKDHSKYYIQFSSAGPGE